MAAGGPVPVSQIAATIAADGDNGPRSSHPPAFSTVSHGKNAAAAGARLPLPASIPGCRLRKERCGGGRSPFPFPLLSPAAACGKNAAAAGGTCVPARRTARPSRAKAHLITRHPPRTIKNRPPIRAKNAAPLCRTAAIKNKKQDARSGRPASLDAATT